MSEDEIGDTDIVEHMLGLMARARDLDEFKKLVAPYKYTAQRDLVTEIASTEPQRALEIAKSITEPWFRCQALAQAALYQADRGQFEAAISDSFASASEMTGEFNRIVAVSAWPLSVVCHRGEWQQAGREVDRLLDVIAQEPSPVRRANALRLLTGAVWDAPDELLRSVLDPLVAACVQPLRSGKRNRRGESWLVDVLPAIDRCSSVWAEQVVDRINGPAVKARARDLLEKLKQGFSIPCGIQPSLRYRNLSTLGKKGEDGHQER